MAPIVVYRIEDSEGKGPWTARGHDGFSAFSLDMNGIPSPACDGSLVLKHDDFCAFGTLERMNFWVTESDWHALRAAGFRLRTFMCPPGTVKIGLQQVLFKRAEAQPIEDSEDAEVV